MVGDGNVDDCLGNDEREQSSSLLEGGYVHVSLTTRTHSQEIENLLKKRMFMFGDKRRFANSGNTT